MQYKYGKGLYFKIIYNHFPIRPKLNLKFNASLVKWLGKSRDKSTRYMYWQKAFMRKNIPITVVENKTEKV